MVRCPRCDADAAPSAGERTREWPEAAEAVEDLKELVGGAACDALLGAMLERAGVDRARLKGPRPPRDPFYDAILVVRVDFANPDLHMCEALDALKNPECHL